MEENKNDILEPEVTPEMAEAGARVLRELYEIGYTEEDSAKMVYKAMRVLDRLRSPHLDS